MWSTRGTCISVYECMRLRVCTWKAEQDSGVSLLCCWLLCRLDRGSLSSPEGHHITTPVRLLHSESSGSIGWASSPSPCQQQGYSHVWLFMWMLGSQKEILMLTKQALLYTAPSPQALLFEISRCQGLNPGLGNSKLAFYH